MPEYKVPDANDTESNPEHFKIAGTRLITALPETINDKRSATITIKKRRHSIDDANLSKKQPDPKYLMLKIISGKIFINGSLLATDNSRESRY